MWVCAAVVLTATVARPGPAAAHSNLVAASPAQGQTVGAPLDTLELAFDNGVRDMIVTLTGPDGMEIDAEVVALAAHWVEVPAPPGGWTEGRWRVAWSLISADDDPVDGAFVFTYRADALPALPLTVAEVTLPDSPWWEGTVTAMAIGAAVLGVVVGAVVLAARVRRLRQLRASGRSQGEPGERAPSR